MNHACMNENVLLSMSGMPDYEQKELHMQRKAPQVRFANGMNCYYNR